MAVAVSRKTLGVSAGQQTYQPLIVNIHDNDTVYASSKQLGGKRIILLDNRRKIGINQIDIVKGEFLCDLVDNVHPENGSLRTADRYRNVDVLFSGTAFRSSSSGNL